MSRIQSVNWYLPFKSGHILVEDFELCGHTSWSHTVANV